MATDSLAGHSPASLPGTDPRSPRRRLPLLSQDIPWAVRLRVVSVWLVVTILGTMALVAPLPFTGQVALRVGDVAASDVTSPRQVAYTSEILTQQRREVAANAVPEVYDPPQARIGRQQLNVASQLLDFIASVRSDATADETIRKTYLKSVMAVELPAQVIDRILTMPGHTWDIVSIEVQSVLDRTMHEEIRESTLADERRKVPARVRLDLSDEDAAVASLIVQGLTVPNSFYNAQKTEERRRQARERVEPVTATVERNEKILRVGDIVTALDMEALDALGLSQPTWTWQGVRAAGSVMLLLGILFLYYLWRQEPRMWFGGVELPLLAGVFLLFLLVARLVVPGHTVLSHVYPYAALAMLIAVLVNLRMALVFLGLFALLTGWLSGSIEMATYAFAGSLFGALKLRRGERLASFAWATLYIVAANLLVVVAFRLGVGKVDLRGLAELSAASVLNGLATITVTVACVYVVGALFGVATPLQLMELSRPTHPLLRQLILKAPGTYHHTLIVSNMAERAAEAIGADAQLARVGAYYHDVGKAIRPFFFVENRRDAQDPHARLDPSISAQIITSHVKDGMELARKYRLPQRIIDFIPEHHGTLLVSYFYHKAVEQAGKAEGVNRALFAYAGPRPRSRETAITMLADGAEATVRSKKPASIEELNRTIAQSIQGRIADGQLEECPLTLGDLPEIQRAFADILRGIHHPRLVYPEQARPEAPLADPAEKAE